MKFKSVTLRGFKRLGFGSVKKFSLIPHEFCQLILGINGYGKSMLMKEISPLPGNKNDYYPGGEKIVEIDYLGESYILKTVYKTSVKCSFIKVSTNEELNTGGTQAVQIELAKDIFGYTQDIHYLLHSRESFTEMSMKRRREWFIEVSNMNYDYAISFWNVLKDHLRDTQGAIKQSKKRLIEESQSALTEEERNKLREEIEKTEKEIKNYESLISHQKKTDLVITEPSILDKYLENIKSLTLSLIKSIVSYHKYHHYYPEVYTLSEKEMENAIETLIRQEQSKETEIKMLSEKIDELKKAYHNAVKTEKINPLEIEKEIREIDEILSQKDDYDFTTYPKDRERLLSCISHLTYWLHEKPSEILSFSMNELQSLKEAINKQEKLVDEKRERLQTLRVESSILLDKKKQHHLTCPNCQHDFIPGYDEKALMAISQEGKALKPIVDQEILSLEKMKKDLLAMENTYQWKMKYKTIREKYPEFSFLYTKDIDSLLYQFQNYQMSLERYLSKSSYLKRKEELIKLLSTLSNIKEKSEEEYKNEIISQEALLVSLYKEKEDYKKQYDIYKSLFVIKFDRIPTIKKQLEEEEIKLVNAEHDYITYITNQSISKIVNSLKVSIGEKIKLDQEFESKFKVIEYFSKHVEDLEEKESLLKIIVQELSPQKGLIAEGLSKFIKVFLSNMNLLIKQIWSYPLIVGLPEVDNDNIDLSFKFPMQVGLNHETIEDVNLGSSGIREVINLAFKLTAMKSLRLEHYPLFLDEFGASFDIQHRTNATNVIRNIIEERIHSQLFIVSHYESSYGSLSNCDVCLLSEDIPYPFDKVNQHVVIEKGEYHVD